MHLRALMRSWALFTSPEHNDKCGALRLGYMDWVGVFQFKLYCILCCKWLHHFLNYETAMFVLWCTSRIKHEPLIVFCFSNMERRLWCTWFMTVVIRRLPHKQAEYWVITELGTKIPNRRAKRISRSGKYGRSSAYAGRCAATKVVPQNRKIW